MAETEPVGADMPGWMMTELGPLAAKGEVTMDKFIAVLECVLLEDAWESWPNASQSRLMTGWTAW